VIINSSKLRKEYQIEDMCYLDSDNASMIYSIQADMIKGHNLKGLVDVGCRLGNINKYLHGYDYNYYGFDSSTSPIEYAAKLYDNLTFEVRDWENLQMPEFEVDAVIFGSILIYDSDPILLFERICSFYNPRCAIVHEVNNKNTEDLKYTDLSYFINNYKCETHTLDLDIPCGKRTIINVEYR
jgi:trans-aconitate methyltransferase